MTETPALHSFTLLPCSLVSLLETQYIFPFVRLSEEPETRTRRDSPAFRARSLPECSTWPNRVTRLDAPDGARLWNGPQ